MYKRSEPSNPTELPRPSSQLCSHLFTADPLANGSIIDDRAELEVGGNQREGDSGRGLVHDGSDLDELVDGALKVVGAAEAALHVEGRLGLGVTRGQDLEDVHLAAARLPAAAVAVLLRARDAGVERPDGRHVAVEAAVAVEGHLEVEEEDLVGATEALCVVRLVSGQGFRGSVQGGEMRGGRRRTVGNVVGASKAAVAVALLVAPDGELLVRTDEDVLQELGRVGAGSGLIVDIRERVAPSATDKSVMIARTIHSLFHSPVPDTRSLTTVVAKEHEVLGSFSHSVVVSTTLPCAGTGDQGRLRGLLPLMQMGVTMAMGMAPSMDVSSLCFFAFSDTVEVIDGELLQVDRATNVDRKLRSVSLRAHLQPRGRETHVLVQGSKRSAVWNICPGALAIHGHPSNSLEASAGTNTIILDLLNSTAEPVATLVASSAGAQVGGGSPASGGQEHRS